MFTPTIDLKVLTNATVLRITDTTGPDTGDGTKWDGTSGIDSTNVSAASLVVTDPNGDVTTIDVTTTITGDDPITGDIVFTDQTGEWVDGYYNVVYDNDTWECSVPPIQVGPVKANRFPGTFIPTTDSVLASPD